MCTYISLFLFFIPYIAIIFEIFFNDLINLKILKQYKLYLYVYLNIFT